MAGILAALSAGARLAANKAQATPSVVQTAGAGGIGNRINQIEGRLQALESSNTSSAAPQPAAVAPAETPAPQAEPQSIIPPNVATAASAMGITPPAAESLAPVADALGEKFSATPFFQRQRANSGPLMFKDQTGDGKITRADVIKARIEGYKK